MRPLLPHSPVAQLAEHPAVNRRVVGSSPTRGATPFWASGSRMVERSEMCEMGRFCGVMLLPVLSSDLAR